MRINSRIGESFPINVDLFDLRCEPQDLVCLRVVTLSMIFYKRDSTTKKYSLNTFGLRLGRTRQLAVRG
jgi:hypothetical protein